MAKHNALGREGEQIACTYLLAKGYSILHRNYRYRKAEIDIIARREGILAIVEVKYRSKAFIEHIADTVNRKKINLLVMAADHYVTDNDINLEVRFDIITILKSSDTPKIEHLEDAFYHF